MLLYRINTMDVNEYHLLESNEFWERVGRHLEEMDAEKDKDNADLKGYLKPTLKTASRNKKLSEEGANFIKSLKNA